jgi:hypothetical protein
MKFKFNFNAAIFAASVALAVISFFAAFVCLLFENWIGVAISATMLCCFVFIIAGMGDSM